MGNMLRMTLALTVLLVYCLYGCTANRVECWAGDQCDDCISPTIVGGQRRCCPNCSLTSSLQISNNNCFCGREPVDQPVTSALYTTHATTALVRDGRLYKACWGGPQCVDCTSTWINYFNQTMCCDQCGPNNYLYYENNNCYCGVHVETPFIRDGIHYKPCWSGSLCDGCGSTFMQGGELACCEDCGPTNNLYSYNGYCYCGVVNTNASHRNKSFIFSMITPILAWAIKGVMYLE